jgi:hypothetical protein
MSKIIISSLIIIVFITSCQYYTDFWIPPEKINLSNRKMYKSKHCEHIHWYDIHYSLCSNQKCKDQWNKYLLNKSNATKHHANNWNFYLKECRKVKHYRPSSDNKHGYTIDNKLPNGQ